MNDLKKSTAQTESATPAAGDCEPANKPYETPVLTYYGDVRDVTLGPTVGIGESGNELSRRNPP